MKYLNYCPYCIKANCEQCRQFNITQVPSKYAPQRFYYTTRMNYYETVSRNEEKRF